MTGAGPSVAARVVGLGQEAAGDDAVGLAVIGWLRERGAPSGVELRALREPSALLPLLEEAAPLVIVDAACAGDPGRVLELTPDDLARSPFRAPSTHGLTVPGAIELALALAGGSLPAPVRLVAVTIPPPLRHTRGLSAPVAAAVPGAGACVLALLERFIQGAAEAPSPAPSQPSP